MLGGRVAMITGASSGIGAAAARLFAVEGAAVALMARRGDRLARLAEEIRAAGGRVVVVEGDVTSSEAVERCVATAVDTFGKLDAAFNNAGHATVGPLLHEVAEDDFARTMDVNVRGVWNCLRHQIPAMLACGGGAVVNTSSVAGVLASSASAAYVAAKHAVIGLTRAAAREYGRHGIRANALVVGSTRTEMMEQVLAGSPELEERFVAHTLRRRMAAPEEIAQAAAWLCSERSGFVTGAAVPVDGGRTAV